MPQNYALSDPAVSADELPDLSFSHEVAPLAHVNTTTGIGAKKEFLKKFEKTLKGNAHEKSPATRKAENLLRKSLRAYKKHDYLTSVQLAVNALELDEEHAQGHHILAMGLEHLGQLHKSLLMYERSIQLDPTDAELYINLGLAAWKMQMLDGAERLFRIYIEMKPDMHSGYNNLGGILRDKGDMDDAIEILRQAIFRFPLAAELWNSMGTVMMESGQIGEAKTFYEEALRLNEKYGRAYHNIAHLINHTGPRGAATEYYETALSLTPEGSPDYVEVLHGRAISKIDTGDLANGWKEYEVRHAPGFRGSTLYAFREPMWQGGDLAGKRLLLMAEQGIGDEIMFSNAVPEIIEQIGPDGKLLMAVDPRLVTLFARSFPDATVGPYAGARSNAKLVRHAPWMEKVGGIDYYAPLGSTLQYLRDDISKFPTDQNLLKPNPERVEFWRGRLKELSDGPYVGVCWRSMVMTTQRSKYFSPLELWGPVLNNKDITFINLQYGDCADDLALVKELYGREIHDFEDLNLKDDLDDNAALCAALDLVISAPTAASTISGSVGTKLFIPTVGFIWPMLGTDTMPWYSDAQIIKPDEYQDWEDMMAKLGHAVEEFLQAR